MPKLFFALCLILAASSASSQEISECDWRSEARFIVQPWQDNAREFLGGAVQIARLGTSEFTLGSMYLLVMWPNHESGDYLDCRIIGFRDGHGFANLDFAELELTKETDSQMALIIPGLFVLYDEDFSNSVLLSLELNISTGQLSAEIALGNE